MVEIISGVRYFQTYRHSPILCLETYGGFDTLSPVGILFIELVQLFLVILIFCFVCLRIGKVNTIWVSKTKQQIYFVAIPFSEIKKRPSMMTT